MDTYTYDRFILYGVLPLSVVTVTCVLLLVQFVTLNRTYLSEVAMIVGEWEHLAVNNNENNATANSKTPHESSNSFSENNSGFNSLSENSTRCVRNGVIK
jgi:hypothetical protein